MRISKRPLRDKMASGYGDKRLLFIGRAGMRSIEEDYTVDETQ